MTELDQLVNSSPELKVIAKSGGLSPNSTTHGTLNDTIKPDILCEGGNVIWDGTISDTYSIGLSIMTINKNFAGKPLTVTSGTSPATAASSRMLAQIWETNPKLRPETVRGLLIHSASWTPEMLNQFPNKRDLLRACGYGTPNVTMACHSALSAVTLIAEDNIKIWY
jgi:hypothetical protein